MSVTGDKNYAHPTKTDWFGDRSVTLLGDSISFGVGSTDIPTKSYASYVKAAIGGANYGFTSAYPTSWRPAKGDHAHEIHAWPDRSQTGEEFDWICDNNDDGRRMISVGQTAKKQGAVLTFTLREEYRDRGVWFCVYYHTEPGGGSFAVADAENGVLCDRADRNGKVIYTCDNTVHETKRTAFYGMSDMTSGSIRIVVKSDGAPVTITGIGYYNDLSDTAVTFNNFSRGGIKLSNLSDTVLDQATASETLIIGLGYNDSHFGYDPARFTDRIDYLIRAVQKNGTNLIVNDYGLYDEAEYKHLENEILHSKSELRRLVRETGGIYVDQQAIHGDAILQEAYKYDKVHPTDEGHAMIARALIVAMGL